LVTGDVSDLCAGAELSLERIEALAASRWINQLAVEAAGPEKEQRAARVAAYRRGRARLVGLLLDRDGEGCAWCGRELARPRRPYSRRAPIGRRLTIDHVIARSAGGASTPENLVLACWRCNVLDRGDDSAVSFLTRCLAAGRKPRSQVIAARLIATGHADWLTHPAMLADRQHVTRCSPGAYTAV
jgi:hypothetical protein